MNQTMNRWTKKGLVVLVSLSACHLVTLSPCHPQSSAGELIVEQPPARLRSGPPSIACWAHPSNTKAYCGYYVGGGSVGCRGQPRLAEEGTWGWDYHGCWLPQRVFLQWWHGRCSQGGAGAYRVDGPHPLKTLRNHAEGCGPP